jgi:hypothetical protein
MEMVNEILVKIKDKPGLFLGKKSLSLLVTFLDGYLLAKRECGVEIKIIDARFQDWVAKRYCIKSSHRWSEIIVFFEKDEGGAFDTFFELYNEFLAEKD